MILSGSIPEQAVILAGGKGKRLRPITNSIPKPMIKFHNIPFLEHLIIQLKNQGIKKILLLLGYLPHIIQDYFKDGQSYGILIEYSVTDVDNDTGMRLSLAKHKIDQFFYMLYCDNYLPINFLKMWQHFIDSSCIGQLTIYTNKDDYTKSNLRLNNHGIIEFYDKTRLSNSLQGVDLGYAIFNKDVLNYLPDKNVNFENEVYPALVSIKKLSGYTTDHRYYSVSNHDRLHLTEQFFQKKKFVILDRDGVLNIKQPKSKYVTNWKDFKWIDGVKESLVMLSKADIQLIIVTNQAGIARGFMSINDLNEIHNNMKKELSMLGVKIAAIYFCPHGWNDNCECRKPKPGMLYKAQKDFHLDLTQTIFIGDDDRDMQAGESAGCITFLVTHSRSLLDIVKNNILI